MKAIDLRDPPAEVVALIESRRALGIDGHDEVWEGVYRMPPHADGGHAWLEAQLPLVLWPRARAKKLFAYGAANLGDASDYRVPDGVVTRNRTTNLYFAAATMVIEILSPDDDTYRKFEFYAARGVVEILVVDWRTRTVRCFQLTKGAYEEQSRSALLDVDTATLVDEIDWP